MSLATSRDSGTTVESMLTLLETSILEARVVLESASDSDTALKQRALAAIEICEDVRSQISSQGPGGIVDISSRGIFAVGASWLVFYRKLAGGSFV